jgi:hypothetical protein
MKLKTIAISVVSVLLGSAPAGAQIVADLVAESEIPAGSLFAPHTPSGMAIIEPNLWVGDDAYAAVYDHQKGQPFQVGGPGVWMVQFQSAFGNFSPFAGISPVAANLGLAGDQPTTVALGPDGKLYVGFLKNGNIKRVTNPSVLNPTPQNQTVESVGTTPNGRSLSRDATGTAVWADPDVPA